MVRHRFIRRPMLSVFKKRGMTSARIFNKEAEQEVTVV